ncbi:MAG TPA: TetR/AcrR family transcriptional regulator [Solirubrobacteraceae bacterium]
MATTPDTDDRILDATLVEVGAHGADGTTIDAIAARAGVARITVFRRFHSKGALVQQMVLRELRRFLDELQATPSDDPAERIAEAFVACIRVSRDHPLAARLVREEPGNVFAQLTRGAPSALDIGIAFVSEELRALELGGERPDEIAELLVRLALTYVLVPSGAFARQDDQAARAFAERALVPIVLGPAN